MADELTAQQDRVYENLRRFPQLRLPIDVPVRHHARAIALANLTSLEAQQ